MGRGTKNRNNRPRGQIKREERVSPLYNQLNPQHKENSMYNVTLIKDVRKPRDLVHRTYSFENLYKFLIKDRPLVPKINQVAWSPCIFIPGTKRANKYAIELSLMVLDIDAYYSYTDIKYVLDDNNLRYIMHMTSSATEEVDKFRVVLPMDRPIPAEEWRFHYEGMLDWFRDNIQLPIAAKMGTLHDGRDVASIDTCTIDPARAYFAGYRTKWFDACLKNEGQIVDWDQYAQRARLRIETLAEKKRLEAIERQKKAEAHLKNLEGRQPSYSDRRKYVYDMLKTQRDWRERLAQRLNCTIIRTANGDRAEGFVCPQCHRQDATYFYMNPYYNSTYARCGHLKSCNPVAFRAPLGYLAEITGNLDNL